MGWWSTDIMGGDTPLDFEDAIYDICKIDKFPEEGGIANVPAVILEEKLDEIISMIDADTYSAGIGYQVLAVLMMKAGATIPVEIKDEMIESCHQDEWADEDDERQTSINGLLEALALYDNKTPIIIKSKGLFEVMVEKLNKTEE